MMIKKLISLMLNKAPLSQYYLELGTFFLKKGVGKKVGDPVKYKIGKKNKQHYIANLHYDFANNRINHTLTNKKPGEKS